MQNVGEANGECQVEGVVFDLILKKYQLIVNIQAKSKKRPEVASLTMRKSVNSITVCVVKVVNKMGRKLARYRPSEML